ncbi:methyltransferase domain-containing protein [Streptomyces sp. NPDC050549]|uniref:class I SAM-dependent methyltransferase n=1 Tax=Streptomyces sp. NPDC050549 TaxID=3155406 RepID=UPI00342BC451
MQRPSADAGRGDRATELHADGAELPLADGAFDSVVRFTMLHHVPTAAHQDRIFAEVFHVSRPGGTFAGSDGRPSFRFAAVYASGPAGAPNRSTYRRCHGVSTACRS